jgi:dienelactone hydrolase
VLDLLVTRNAVRCLFGAIVTAASACATADTDSRQGAFQPPVNLTTEADHARTLELLGIAKLRPGVSGSPDAPNAANYDEAKANPYPKLPDPLLFDNGARVASADEWPRRRAEIAEHFAREIYGRMPASTPAVTWRIERSERESLDGVPIVTKHLLGKVDNASYPLIDVEIQLTVTTPADARGPVPLVMEYQYLFPPTINPEIAERMRASAREWQRQVLAKGWGFALYLPGSVQADNGAGLTRGIIGLINKGQPRKLDDWGALRAWGWGASRALDYLESDPDVDAKRVALAGHSRFGKSVLVTMADDPRFALAFVSSSGAAGAKPHRRNYGELVENTAAPSEYHWLAGNFLKYAGTLTWDDLPVDSHQLIALSAPRPLFIGAGTLEQGDGWIDPKGSFIAAVAATPVYELLGKRGLSTQEFPAVGVALIDGDLAFRQHPEGHVTGPNWPVFLDFASRYFAR